jgi:hypothetical protein
MKALINAIETGQILFMVLIFALNNTGNPAG